MKLLMGLVLAAFSSSVFAAVETRCGWIDNPTPANYWITDADGEWIISIQGGYQAEGDLAYPSDYEYVKTNVNYGYYCGCINATVDKANERIVKIFSASTKKLSACLNDKALPQDYKPRTVVHSSGKAFTECKDQDEQQIVFRNRPACVNQSGDYYFLAN